MFGSEMRRLRLEKGLSLRALAHQVRYDYSYLSRIEKGERPPPEDLPRLLDRLFQAGSRFQVLAGPSRNYEVGGQSPAGLPLAAITGRDVRIASSSHVVPSLVLDHEVTPQVGSDRLSATAANWSIDADFASGDVLTTAIQSFRAADKHVGGGHLYPTVVNFLQGEVAPRLFGIEQTIDSHIVFTAAAALTEMAGWMAHDAGRNEVAERHFARSLDLVQVGNNRQLCAHILSSMSHLAHHCGRPIDAIQLAQRGREVLSAGVRQPEIESRLCAMEARGFAGLRKVEDCRRLLFQAEHLLTTSPDEPRSSWVSPFDEGSLASEAARCMKELGDTHEAQRQAERVIELRPGDRTRSRALGQLMLVSLLVAQGKPDEACSVAQNVLDTTEQLGSHAVIEQLRGLQQLLVSYRGHPVVDDFVCCLDGALRQRAWLYQPKALVGLSVESLT